ncbi:glycosyltransferase [Umezakia ovalisporum]|jgi:glycosyltransferase involved in cell wall biosynthesis|uniref:Glycosyltransferase n=2 Tax=Umezakia ovalisporum TaxID=75695 RepID=A0AA43GYP1_9CYAN|nr:glycosyltransferase [Umezakia ovalisporum]MDH6058348.1 glycosyltransferase [Umezakia ovalisporum FSS-43]MDH6063940.1 glycosyltransferase [Umezakia ovalisporum FSS-62]MDH6071495.1 glycosyltransferase [Umezakia ovalisporum CobakiLakeA]MDH6073163.1 glycosyltransferase [Umezakia ovalisporum CS-1034]MDH6082801.1 glycosyltransferase [Umezakia ovalisporum FSS-44]
MKSIHTSSWYFPETSGGVEVYIDSLVQGLQTHGVGAIVAACRHSIEEETYKHNNVPVYRYPVFANQRKIQVHKQLPHGGFESFANWLKNNRADVYHQHSWRFDCGLPHLAMAKKLAMATVVTVHMPEPLCLRGTMMRYGQQICNGLIDPTDCSYCLGVPKRVPSWAMATLRLIPMNLGMAAETKVRNYKSIRLRLLGKTFSIPRQVSEHGTQLMQLVKLADRIVVPSQWQYDAFRLNKVPENKLTLCRQGVAQTFPRQTVPRKPKNATLKIGFLGRWQETKGVQVLAEAVHRLPADVAVELIIHATHPQKYGVANREKVLAIAAHDNRIHIAEPLSRQEVQGALAGFDLLAVPSQWLETGPLVVLEAQAVGIPVLGSNLGGIAELVQHGVNGWLVPPQDIQAWSSSIAHFVQNPDLIARLRQGIQPVRTMDNVASEMVQIYREITNNYPKYSAD